MQVSEDISAYGTSTIYTWADVGVTIEAYQNGKVYVLGGSASRLFAYHQTTIEVYDIQLARDIEVFGDSTLNILGGRLGNSLQLYEASHVNVYASTLSGYAFGQVLDTRGTISGVLADGSAFSIPFSRYSSSTALWLIAVPEPETLSLLGLSIAGMAFVRRRRLAAR